MKFIDLNAKWKLSIILFRLSVYTIKLFLATTAGNCSRDRLNNKS